MLVNGGPGDYQDPILYTNRTGTRRTRYLLSIQQLGIDTTHPIQTQYWNKQCLMGGQTIDKFFTITCPPMDSLFLWKNLRHLETWFSTTHFIITSKESWLKTHWDIFTNHLQSTGYWTNNRVIWYALTLMWHHCNEMVVIRRLWGRMIKHYLYGTRVNLQCMVSNYSTLGLI